MGRADDMRASAVVLAVLVAGGCAVFGAGGDPTEPETGSSIAAEAGDARPEVPASALDSADLSRVGAMNERMLAADYEGVLDIYAADSTLHSDPDAVYTAALAAAMSGHPAHDPRRASRLFKRLLEEHPDTSRRYEVELYLDLLVRERDLRAAVERLDRELQQLKAIDLGEAPRDER